MKGGSGWGAGRNSMQGHTDRFYKQFLQGCGSLVQITWRSSPTPPHNWNNVSWKQIANLDSVSLSSRGTWMAAKWRLRYLHESQGYL